MADLRIENNSTSCFVRSLATIEKDGFNTIIWLELAPQPHKVQGAIWASLVNNTAEMLKLYVHEGTVYETVHVRGLSRRYERYTEPTQNLWGRGSRPLMLRLFAPEAAKTLDALSGFFALEWPGQSAAVTLAAMLEHGSHLPIKAEWGAYLLKEGIIRHGIVPLTRYGPAPEGYYVKGDCPFASIITDGIKSKQIAI